MDNDPFVVHMVILWQNWLNTVQCHYNAMQYTMILSSAQQWWQQNKRHPIPRPYVASYGVSCGDLGKKMMAKWHCTVPWLVVILWLFTSPGHQQPQYWICRIHGVLSYMRKEVKYLCLTYWGWDKTAVILQKTFSNTFPCMQIVVFCLKFH